MIVWTIFINRINRNINLVFIPSTFKFKLLAEKIDFTHIFILEAKSDASRKRLYVCV